VHFTTFFDQLGHLQVIYAMYEILGRKLSAESTINRNEISFLYKILEIYKAIL